MTSTADFMGYFFAFLIGTFLAAIIFRIVFDVGVMHKRVKRIYRLLEQIAKEQGVPPEAIQKIFTKGE